jgi:hypothetical protein
LWLCSMKFIDRALAATVAVFLMGAVIGSIMIVLLSAFRATFTMIIQVRMLSPIQSAAKAGSVALLCLVFLNNSIPAVLSFLYPLAIARIPWTPQLTQKRRRILMAGYSYLSGILAGFFGVGLPLGLAWVLGGIRATISLLLMVRIHGPLELFFVLVCLAEPLRLADAPRSEITGMLREQLMLLWAALIGLLISAGIEVLTLL